LVTKARQLCVWFDAKLECTVPDSYSKIVALFEIEGLGKYTLLVNV